MDDVRGSKFGPPLTDSLRVAAVGARRDRCEHGVSYEEFCDPCAHQPAEEWVGYPMTICQFCIVPWPCDWEKERRARV